MCERLIRELAGHAPRMYRVALVALAVAIAGPFSSAVRASAASPAKGAQPAASTAGDVHPALPSVLLLPPRLPAGAGHKDRAAAELACDRLAQDIAAAGQARVVDRTQIDRILQERNLQAAPSRPMLSYDAMIRLNVDTSRLAPEATLALIDLSTGNMIAQRAFAWPPKEADAKPMLDTCREALRGLSKSAAGKVRVRTLWSDDAITNERIKPFGKRLIDVFDEGLRRSDRVVLVHHLEAATAKEESLLLLMGMSRLPGQRQFAPQADATIELRVVEGDGRGKTFPETPLEIGVRLRKGTNYEGDWLTTAGLVRDFDSMIPQAWKKLSQSLSAVRPDTAAAMLDEMSLRRKQADAELELIQHMSEVARSVPGIRNDHDSFEAAMTRLAHAETAVKLDPTYADAARAYVRALHDVSEWGARDAPRRALREAARYMERFRSDGRVCSDLCSDGVIGLDLSPLRELHYPHRGNASIWVPMTLTPVAEDRFVWTADLMQDLDAAKRLLERGIDSDVDFPFSYADSMTIITYRGMRCLGVAAAERQAWLDRVHNRCSEKMKRARARGISPEGKYDWCCYVSLQLHIAELFTEDAQIGRAKSIIRRVQAETPKSEPRWNARTSVFRAVLAKMGDAQLLAEFEQWCKRMEQQEQPGLLIIRWPHVDVYADASDSSAHPPLNHAAAAGSGKPPLPCVAIRIRPEARPRNPGEVYLLTQGDGRLYLCASGRISYVPLDGRGCPVGTNAPNGDHLWDNVRDIPRPRLNNTVHSITQMGCVHGLLCLATRDSGLHVFDPKTEVWRAYGPAQGLPTSEVQQFLPIGGGTVFCNTGDSQYTIDLADGAVRLVKPPPPPPPPSPQRKLARVSLVWREDDRLMAIDDHGVWTDLLGASPQYRRFTVAAYGWKHRTIEPDSCWSAAEINGQRFFTTFGGLHEIDAAGNVVRSWWNFFRVEPARNPTVHIFASATCPLPDCYHTVFSVKSMLVLQNHASVTVYDPTADTWYGPVPFASRFVAPDGGLWGTLPSQEGLAYASLDDVLACAHSMGRVMTTAEYRQRKQQLIDAAEPLDRGKFNLGMRQFGKAKAAFQEVLDAEPNQPEALILMGFLHVRDCLNQPDEAIKYYRRAAELANNPNASFSGMYFWACVLRDRQQWRESIEMCEKILQRYPGLEQPDRQRIQELCDSGRQQLAQKDAKQPAAGTSNKEERPVK